MGLPLGDLGQHLATRRLSFGQEAFELAPAGQARRFAPRIVFFDKDRGAELFIRAIGGQYDRLRPDAPSGLNPLQIDDSAANRQFLIEWLSLLAGEVSSDEVEVLKDAVEANFAQPRPHRRLRHLVELLRGHARPRSGDLYARMRPWWGEGERAWLFDNAEDQTDLFAATVGFDMTAILDDPVARTPAMLYLFHRVEERLDGSPAIIVVDEGWKALDDDVFVRRIKDWEKTIRKRNGIVGFATQSASDALESRIASAIVEQAATQVFMINPKARAEDYIDGFGLTPHEFELVRTLPDSSHCFLIKHGNDSVVARLNLSGEQDLLTILSGREATVRFYDELAGASGVAPADWIERVTAIRSDARPARAPSSYAPPLPPYTGPIAGQNAAAPPAPAFVYQAPGAKPAAGAGGSDKAGDGRISAARFTNPSTTVPQGAVIQAVLETALDSNRPGFARAVVTRDVFSFDGSRVLIQRGSKLFGEYKADLALGQNRALIQWHRLTRPDGVIIDIDSPSADPLGRAGVKGKVNSHFFTRFGSAILQSFLDVGVQLAARKATGDTIIVGLPGSMPQVTVAKPDEVKPTLTVKEGTSVSVFVVHDLDFTEVEQ